LVLDNAAMPFIPFRDKTNPHAYNAKWKENNGTWKRMYHFYELNREHFMAHYHKRSNVESTFSMFKAKFGERIRSKTKIAQTNEVLCKVLAHNLCCVIQSIYEFGIEPTLWSNSEIDHKV
jgi:transposase